jgi:hypothetical protein
VRPIEETEGSNPSPSSGESATNCSGGGLRWSSACRSLNLPAIPPHAPQFEGRTWIASAPCSRHFCSATVSVAFARRGASPSGSSFTTRREISRHPCAHYVAPLKCAKPVLPWGKIQPPPRALSATNRSLRLCGAGDLPAAGARAAAMFGSSCFGCVGRSDGTRASSLSDFRSSVIVSNAAMRVSG